LRSATKDKNIIEITPIDTLNPKKHFTLSIGIWKPLGNLENTFFINPNLSIRSITGTKKVQLHYFATFNFPIKSNEFNFYNDNITYIVSSKNIFNGNIGLGFTHINYLGQKIFIDKYIGFGYSYIITNLERESICTAKKNHVISTLNGNLGVSIGIKNNNNKLLGCFIEYNLSPYSLLKKVDKNFGYSFLITGITFGL